MLTKGGGLPSLSLTSRSVPNSLMRSFLRWMAIRLLSSQCSEDMVPRELFDGPAFTIINAKRRQWNLRLAMHWHWIIPLILLKRYPFLIKVCTGMLKKWLSNCPSEKTLNVKGRICETFPFAIKLVWTGAYCKQELDVSLGFQSSPNRRKHLFVTV